MKTLKAYVDRTEKRYLENLMKSVPNNTIAAQIAGVTRVQLFRLLKKYNIDRSQHATQRPG